MYLLFAVLLPLLLIMILLNHRRKKCYIRKVQQLCMEEKCEILEQIIRPFGYSYVLSQDIFSSRQDAWQRDMGYCRLYDKAAVHFRMVFDALPVYFNYHGRTWLLEFWKGQYGITTGGEIGLYYADRILSDEERGQTLFQAVENRDMLRLSLALYQKENRIAVLTGNHWWLTTFRLGLFSKPEDLTMCASIDFPNVEMARAFVSGLRDTGYVSGDICQQCNTVTFYFDTTTPRQEFFSRLAVCFALQRNRFWCKMFLFITRPFEQSIDRILYLYYYLPFAFRKTLRIRRYKKNRKGGGFA